MIEVVEETASTNADLVRRLGAGEGIAEGFWLRAVRQSAGRGRRGKEWSSPEGNLYTSTVIALRADDPAAHTLAFVAALAVRDLIAALLPADAAVQLKWPNDVLVAGAKISGILLERCGDHVIVGIGINLVSAPELADRATASVLASGGSDVDAQKVLEKLATAYARRLSQWRSEGLSATLRAWQQHAYPQGTPLKVVLDGEGEALGAFAGLDPDGALRLRLPDGSLRVIHAGDVSLV
ncbi:BirA family biotin operon repressor/biotin-[acetyl-CoA-carboxylase] ligase [Novosphingobium sp. PhB165]|uniref:biotin--[acetyl-CoA-carboxylase] ligase n=1 Tax=Novosphingobium sp. PhB165 TaxID=2485105 RepID=UPI0010523D61|nr:biotin--[acetyl-CoA-carboxylase] ligase [Novosphingobium sp. PhB165]TCM22218.1 BirA family biotin operon repressor/biotin-[acetyl-CoA-carboxylase] ligase [Novosphingobium sp. PhB165]